MNLDLYQELDILGSALAGLLNERVEAYQTLESVAAAAPIEPHEAYFQAPQVPLKVAMVETERFIKGGARCDLGLDAAEEVREFTDQVLKQYPTAKLIQERAALAQWMNFLARSDRGVREAASGEDGGIDLEGMDATPMGDPSRGVMRLYLRGKADLSVEVTSAAVAGLNPKTIAMMGPVTPADAGIAVVADAALGGYPRGGAELGENDRGVVTLHADRGGEAWMSRYATGDTNWGPDAELDSPQAGARRLLNDVVWDTPFAELGVRHG